MPASRSPKWKGEPATARCEPIAASSPRRSSSTPSAGAASSAPGPTSSRPTPRSRAASRSTRTAAAPTSTSGSTARSSAAGYAWSVPADGEQRVGVGSYEPRDHVKEPTQEIARRLAVHPVRYQGNWFPHRLRDATDEGVFFVGDSAGHCIPLSGEGIRTAFYFGIAAGRRAARRHRAATDARAGPRREYADFSAEHAPFFARALALQRAIPRIPPRALTALLSLAGRERLCTAAFGWYLDQIHPRYAVRHVTDPLHLVTA